MPLQNETSKDSVAAIRSFNRFYTHKIGVLNERLLRTPYSLAESRILYELGTRSKVTATGLCLTLDLDVGYLSRLLAGLQRRRLIRRVQSADDGRRNIISLTRSGRAAFRTLDTRSRREIQKMLTGVSRSDRGKLLDAMKTIERVLIGAENSQQPRVTLRRPEVGDMGWVVERHGRIYAEEYGWNARFEAVVAQIVADFVRKSDPARERCWIAEIDGRRVGSVFLVRKNQRVARLRLLLVEQHARGFGFGGMLVDECIAFARASGYRAMTLWTNNVLTSARRIYEARGFRLVSEVVHTDYGPQLTGQTWELKL
jgi:DNA-binding MarR family transcriptional regulator/GNAT superfamily N-acetyltransferase